MVLNIDELKFAGQATHVINLPNDAQKLTTLAQSQIAPVKTRERPTIRLFENNSSSSAAFSLDKLEERTTNHLGNESNPNKTVGVAMKMSRPPNAIKGNDS